MARSWVAGLEHELSPPLDELAVLLLQHRGAGLEPGLVGQIAERPPPPGAAGSVGVAPGRVGPALGVGGPAPPGEGDVVDQQGVHVEGVARGRGGDAAADPGVLERHPQPADRHATGGGGLAGVGGRVAGQDLGGDRPTRAPRGGSPARTAAAGPGRRARRRPPRPPHRGGARSRGRPPSPSPPCRALRGLRCAHTPPTRVGPGYPVQPGL